MEQNGMEEIIVKINVNNCDIQALIECGVKLLKYSRMKRQS